MKCTVRFDGLDYVRLVVSRRCLSPPYDVSGPFGPEQALNKANSGILTCDMKHISICSEWLFDRGIQEGEIDTAVHNFAMVVDPAPTII